MATVDDWSLVDHLTSWITWGLGAVVGIISSAITATYFIATLKSDIEELQKRMDDNAMDKAELRKNLREVVHDLRNEFQKMHGDNQFIMKRIDEHLLRVESKTDQRFDQLIKFIVSRNGVD